jgi:hypothetical protein
LEEHNASIFRVEYSAKQPARNKQYVPPNISKHLPDHVITILNTVLSEKENDL